MIKNSYLNSSKSLSKRLTIILLLGVTIVSTFTTYFVYTYNKNIALNEFKKNNSLIITQLKGSLIQPIWNIDSVAIKFIADSFTRNKTVGYLEVYDESNKILYSYNSKYINNLVFNDEQITKDKEIISYFKIAFSKHELNEQLNNILFANIAVLLITLSTISILTIFVFKILLKKPLDNLIKTTMDFSNGNYDSRITINFKEFMPLIKVLNSMGKKISKQVYLLNEHKATLENKVKERTLELAKEKQYINSIMNSQNSMVMTSNGEKIKTVNKAFTDFFDIENINMFLDQNSLINISENSSILYIKDCAQSFDWLNEIYENQNKIHKIKLDNNIFDIKIDRFTFEGEGLYTIVLTNITELEKIKDKIEEISLHTRESIEYSALIQNSLIPSKDLFLDYFNDSFLIWQPKDIVGGDIYLFENLRNKDECLLMLIDCTGHGVPGAFVSMLVKAIEKQITTLIKASIEEVHTGKILQEFNKEMKNILEQKKSENQVNAGFDGAIMYFNKKDNIIRYAGARIPLYYTKDEKLNTIKGDRYSVGYNHSDISYEFTQHELKVEPGMTFYLASDGYVDQSGGEKGFSFGRKRFENIIKECNHKSLEIQEQVFLDELKQYQNNEERYDDITLLAIKL